MPIVTVSGIILMGIDMLYLVNHAESDLGDSFHHGDLDPNISVEGIREIGPLSELFKSRKLDLIVTPSTERNNSTSILLASLTKAHIFVDEGLRTWRMPALSGVFHDKAEAVIKVYLRHPDVKMPQGESANHFLARWKRTFSKYQGMAKMSRFNIAIICNSLNIQAVAGHFRTVDLSFDVEDAGAYEVGPGLTLKQLG